MITPEERERRLTSAPDQFDAAVERAVRLALEEHARDGFPIVIWRDGTVVTVPAEEILALLARQDEEDAREETVLVTPHVTPR